MSTHLSKSFKETAVRPLRRICRQLPEPESKVDYSLIGWITAAVVLFIAWRMFGADLRRYIKIKSM